MSETLVRPVPRSVSLATKMRQFRALTKPRVVQLIVFCAAIGMLLATPGLPPMRLVVPAVIGIWLVAAAAAAFNCLVEQRIDARMARTAWRATATGELTSGQALLFSALLCAAGSALLWVTVNPLTMWLTLATFVGYAVVYTVLLKPLTPQNIVIGGASGAMPPVLGWAAVRGEVGPEALILCLIIFLWTPPHFWALAVRYRDDYEAANVPMMPVVASLRHTTLEILVYSVLMWALTVLIGPTAHLGWLYAVSATLLGAMFTFYALRLYRHARVDRADVAEAMRLFHFSITYLTALFVMMAVDVLVRLH